MMLLADLLDIPTNVVPRTIASLKRFYSCFGRLSFINDTYSTPKRKRKLRAVKKKQEMDRKMERARPRLADMKTLLAGIARPEVDEAEKEARELQLTSTAKLQLKVNVLIIYTSLRVKLTG
jgi:hypothetical protein